MKVNGYFEKLLENIEPEGKFKAYAVEAHIRVREYLETEDSTFSEYVLDSFLYGSYARHTAEGNIKDVDIALITNFDPSSDDDKPSKVLPKLKRALTRLYKDSGATDYQRKSIQVLDPLPEEEDAELTLDIIPTILTGNEDQKLLVPDTEIDEWVESHPKAHLTFTSTLNDQDHGKGMFVPLVKIMKYWWKLHSEVEKAKPKGFWLEVLVGYEFDTSNDSYADHFVTVLENISSRFHDYESFTDVPQLEDPGLPGEALKTSMTLAEFTHFIDAVNDTLLIAKEALGETDEDKSVNLWQAIFGEKFPESARSSIYNPSYILEFLKQFNAPKEQFLQRDYGIPFERASYSVKVDAFITQNRGFRDGFLNKNPFIQKKAKLLFKVINCNVPQPYKVMWKVKNTGREAARIGQQRGEIHKDLGIKQRQESSLYTGTHFVECYIIDSRNICVAWSRIKVRIP